MIIYMMKNKNPNLLSCVRSFQLLKKTTCWIIEAPKLEKDKNFDKFKHAHILEPRVF